MENNIKRKIKNPSAVEEIIIELSLIRKVNLPQPTPEQNHYGMVLDFNDDNDDIKKKKVVVKIVEDDSEARGAGMSEDDEIVGIFGAPFSSVDQLIRTIEVSTRVELTVKRYETPFAKHQRLKIERLTLENEIFLASSNNNNTGIYTLVSNQSSSSPVTRNPLHTSITNTSKEMTTPRRDSAKKRSTSVTTNTDESVVVAPKKKKKEEKKMNSPARFLDEKPVPSIRTTDYSQSDEMATPATTSPFKEEELLLEDVQKSISSNHAFEKEEKSVNDAGGCAKVFEGWDKIRGVYVHIDSGISLRSPRQVEKISNVLNSNNDRNSTVSIERAHEIAFNKPLFSLRPMDRKDGWIEKGSSFLHKPTDIHIESLRSMHKIMFVLDNDNMWFSFSLSAEHRSHGWTAKKDSDNEKCFFYHAGSNLTVYNHEMMKRLVNAPKGSSWEIAYQNIWARRIHRIRRFGDNLKKKHKRFKPNGNIQYKYN